MARTENEKLFRGNEVPPHSQDAVCEICGVSKPLESAHIVPKKRLYDFPEIDKMFIDQDTDCCIKLCRNHHRLYDTFKLDPEDFAKISFLVNAAICRLAAYATRRHSEGNYISLYFYLELAVFSETIHSTYVRQPTRR